MHCLSCPTGVMAPGAKTATLERGSTLLVIRHVPASVCDTCGAATYSADVTERLLALLDDAVQNGAEVLVREYLEVGGGAEESARSRVGAAGR